MCKISVVVPVFNAEKTINRCVSSILSQSFKDFELILIDDGSTDSSYSLCLEAAEKDERIRCISSECRGASFVRNLGIDEARGEYITFADSDDYIDSGCFEFMYRKITDTKADIVICGYMFECGDTVIKNNCGEMLLDKSNYNESMITLKSKELIDSVWNKLYSLDFLRRTGVKMPVGEVYEDIAFNLDLLSYGPKIAVFNESFYHYVQNMGSVTKKYNPQKLEIMKKRARHLKAVTSGIDGYCDFYYIKSVLSAVMDMFLFCDKKVIKESIKNIVADKEFKECAGGAVFGGAVNRAVITVSRIGRAWLLYAFCRLSFLFKYKAKKLFLRMKD